MRAKYSELRRKTVEKETKITDELGKKLKLDVMK